jgi:LacI family transcriptional regulator
MASIKDVAKAAGVSISTVSYALNDDPRIPEITASRIRSIASEIGYFPSAAARNLKKRSTKTVLVAISDFGGPVYHELLDGIHRQLMAEGYTMIVSTGVSSANLLKERSADAAIISDIHLSSESLLRTAAHFGPIIVLDRDLEGEAIHPLTLDNKTAMKAITRHMIQSGGKRLAYVNGVFETYDNRTRREGFLTALQEANLTPFAEYQGAFTKPSGEQVARNLLLQAGELPDGIVCANDEMAIGMIDVFKAAGLRIPMDVKVSGFDDIELASYVQPRLTTVKIDHRNWGKLAAAAALDLIRGETVKIAKVQGAVQIRESV